MHWFLSVAIVSLAFTFVGCEVKVQESPAPVIKKDRKVNVEIDAPGVDVKVKRDK